ncbi:MAG: hypothetical protein QOI26_575, partial [Pseudonocardiales bacterium]|nr:hypothetical protein [Pseudonocardiales bacterium]
MALTGVGLAGVPGAPAGPEQLAAAEPSTPALLPQTVTGVVTGA